MSFTIISKNNEKTFTDKQLINISSKPGYDFQISTPFAFMLTVQYDAKTNRCLLINQFNNHKFLFKGQPIPASMEIDKICKIMIEGTDDFITIKVNGSFIPSVNNDAMSESDIRAIYGNDVNANAKLMLEKQKNDIEVVRVGIIKQVQGAINELHQKISMNSKAGIVMHIALFFASVVSAFGVSNYLTGLPLKDAGSVIQMPTNMKLIVIYALVVFGVGLVMKQGIYLSLQNKNIKSTEHAGAIDRFMIVLASIFYISIYLINVLYYLSADSMQFFAVLISLFFVGTTLTLALGCGYFKSVNLSTRAMLNEYEYREDFEHILKEYQKWIERYANTLSKTKISNIKDRLFGLQLKAVGESLVGIATAPVLAYGVSNTLAMCFPEAAGWIRIQGLRLSPVFLGLATIMIIFAFFSFVSAFTCKKKLQSSNILKQDGFSNFLQHGVEILGLEGSRKLDAEMRRSFTIGVAIIIIEFTMNVSYFMQNLGGDLKGMIISGLAALVPTAILIAETIFLGNTNFEKCACEDLIAKVDKD